MKWLGAIALVVCTALLGMAISAQQDKGTMDDQVQSAIQSRTIPPIDAAQPQEFRTATFAAG